MPTGPENPFKFTTLRRLAVGAVVAAATFGISVSIARAQTTAAVNDSAFQARMNAGYAATRAGNPHAAAAAFDSATQANPKSADAWVSAGYAFMSAKQNANAIARFTSAIQVDPDRDVIRRQLGYLYAGSGDNRNAIAAFHALVPRGKATAQDYLALGNLNALVGQRDSSLRSFKSALDLGTQSGDTAVANAAQKSITNLQAASAANAPGAFVEYYLSPLYQNRFKNYIAFGVGRVGVSAGGRFTPQAYISLRVTRDSKSVGGLQPVLFADNSLLPALGARIHPLPWLTAFAEAGATYPSVSVTPRNWHRDLRAGLLANLANTKPLTSKPTGVTLISEVYADASWYDRFNRDVISYAQWRESLRLVQGNAGAIDIFTRAWGSYDSKHDYYNRVVEGGGGVALHLGAAHRVSIFIDAQKGHYLAVPVGTQPAQNYNDFRVMFVSGLFRSFPFAKP
ncbi:MAG: tetratricopeptide repeat protein [Gemmatimonadaceae bacterium]